MWTKWRKAIHSADNLHADKRTLNKKNLHIGILQIEVPEIVHIFNDMQISDRIFGGF